VKTCSKCKIEKDESEFSKKRTECKLCKNEYNRNYQQSNRARLALSKAKYRKNNEEQIKDYRQNNKEIEKKSQKEYRETHKKEIALYQKEYRKNNKEARKEYDKEYRKNNKEKKKEYEKSYVKLRRKNDPKYAIRADISISISKYLSEKGLSKNGASCLKHLPFTMNEFTAHFNEIFKQSGNEWMNWNNRGAYLISEWNDKDPSTWKWQIDHIVPHSDFNYETMDDQEFKNCWALSNLRPYKAKDNIEEGNRR